MPSRGSSWARIDNDSSHPAIRLTENRGLSPISLFPRPPRYTAAPPGGQSGRAAGSSTVVIPGLAEAAATIRPLAATEAEFSVQGPDLKISLANIPAGSPALAFVFG